METISIDEAIAELEEKLNDPEYSFNSWEMERLFHLRERKLERENPHKPLPPGVKEFILRAIEKNDRMRFSVEELPLSLREKLYSYIKGTYKSGEFPYTKKSGHLQNLYGHERLPDSVYLALSQPKFCQYTKKYWFSSDVIPVKNIVDFENAIDQILAAHNHNYNQLTESEKLVKELGQDGMTKQAWLYRTSYGSQPPRGALNSIRHNLTNYDARIKKESHMRDALKIRYTLDIAQVCPEWMDEALKICKEVELNAE